MTTWYLWPENDNAATREYLAEHLGETYESKERICADGERRNLFKCLAGYTSVMLVTTAAHVQPGLRFRTFREDVKGVIVNASLWERLEQPRTA